MSKSKQESSVTSPIGYDNVEHTREKTILTNVGEIGSSSIEFSYTVRVQLAALSCKFDTLVATIYHNIDTDGSINMCWIKRRINEKGLAEIH